MRMDLQEWQRFFDDEFPDGAILTHIVDVPEGPDNYKFFIHRVKVEDVQDDEPLIKVYPLGLQTKDVRFRVRKLEPFGNGYLVHTPEDDDPDFLITKNFGDQTRKELREVRDILDKIEADEEPDDEKAAS